MRWCIVSWRDSAGRRLLRSPAHTRAMHSVPLQVSPRGHHAATTPSATITRWPSPPIPFSILASKREAGPVCIHEAPAMDQEPVVAGNPGLSVNKAARGQVCSPKMSVQCQLPISSWINGGDKASVQGESAVAAVCPRPQITQPPRRAGNTEPSVWGWSWPEGGCYHVAGSLLL